MAAASATISRSNGSRVQLNAVAAPATEAMLCFLPDVIRALEGFDGPFDAYRLPAAACDVLFASYPAGTVIDGHAHETHNVGVVTSGELLLRVDGRERTYGPGEWYEVGPGVVHSARFDVDSSEVEFWFQTTSTP